MISPLTPNEQFQALNILDYVSDLFTMAGRENYSRADILIVLNHVRNDANLFEPAVLIAQQEAAAQIGSQPS